MRAPIPSTRIRTPKPVRVVKRGLTDSGYLRTKRVVVKIPIARYRKNSSKFKFFMSLSLLLNNKLLYSFLDDTKYHSQTLPFDNKKVYLSLMGGSLIFFLVRILRKNLRTPVGRGEIPAPFIMNRATIGTAHLLSVVYLKSCSYSRGKLL